MAPHGLFRFDLMFSFLTWLLPVQIPKKRVMFCVFVHQLECELIWKRQWESFCKNGRDCVSERERKIEPENDNTLQDTSLVLPFAETVFTSQLLCDTIQWPSPSSDFHMKFILCGVTFIVIFLADAATAVADVSPLTAWPRAQLIISFHIYLSWPFTNSILIIIIRLHIAHSQQHQHHTITSIYA